MAPNSSVAVTIENKPLMFPDKEKAASPKQFTWVLLLKAYKALTCISWLAMALKSTFVSVKKRIAVSEMSEEEGEEPKNKGRLYRFLRVFLAVSVFALVIEIVAHFKKWNLNLINPWEVQGLVQWSYMAWLSFRVDYIAPREEKEEKEKKNKKKKKPPKRRRFGGYRIVPQKRATEDPDSPRKEDRENKTCVETVRENERFRLVEF